MSAVTCLHDSVHLWPWCGVRGLLRSIAQFRVPCFSYCGMPWHAKGLTDHLRDALFFKIFYSHTLITPNWGTEVPPCSKITQFYDIIHQTLKNKGIFHLIGNPAILLTYKRDMWSLNVSQSFSIIILGWKSLKMTASKLSWSLNACRSLHLLKLHIHGYVQQ